MTNQLASPETSPVYKAPPPEVMVLNDTIRDSKWFQTILAPSVAAAQKSGGNVPPLSAETLYRQTVDAINDGKMTMQEAAAGMSTYYKAAILKNSIIVNQAKLPIQTSYPVSMSGALPMTSEKYDFSNYDHVSTALLQDFRTQIYDILPGAKYQRPDAVYKDR